MVGKISTGNFASGLFNYLERDKSEIISKNMLGENKEELTKEFLLCAEMNQRISKPVKHFVISFSDQDKEKLSVEKLEEITKDYLKEMNYDNSQYVAYLHSDTKMPHLHIVTNRIDFNGKSVKDNHEKRRSRAILMKLEQKYDLTKTPKISLNKSKNKSFVEIKMEERLNKKGIKTDKQTMRKYIEEALARKPKSEEKFARLVNSSGMKMIKIKEGNGYKFEYKGVTYKASTVHRDFSYKKLNEIFEGNRLDRRKQITR